METSGQDLLTVKAVVTLEPSALAGLIEELSSSASLPGVQSVELEIPSTTLTLTNLPRPLTSKDVLAGGNGQGAQSVLVCADCGERRFHRNSCMKYTGQVLPDQELIPRV